MFTLPEWTCEFHGHRRPFMPIGYRMGTLMLGILKAPRAQDHDYFLLPELGVGHPQTCMMDGLQASTGCTYGKLMIERLVWSCRLEEPMKYGDFLRMVPKKEL
ncbi:MAG: FmdE family protein [Methanothrix sp.]|nr:FmdE family protein [Methanothrix sp.]